MPSTNRIGRLRNGQQMTTTELGALCGVHEHTVRRWESGKTGVPQKHWDRLSELFGVSVAYMLGLTEDGDGDNGEEKAA